MGTEEFLGKVALFKHLDEASLSHLAAKLKQVSFSEGPIVKKGDPGDSLYIVKSGLASVTTSGGPSGTEAVLAILKSGDSFGEVSLIDGKPRTADVTATGPVECYILSRDDFTAALLFVFFHQILIRGIDLDGVDPLLFGEFESFEDFRFRVIGLEEFGNVDQVAAMGPATDEIAADQHAADFQVADLSAGHRLAVAEAGSAASRPTAAAGVD